MAEKNPAVLFGLLLVIVIITGLSKETRVSGTRVRDLDSLFPPKEIPLYLQSTSKSSSTKYAAQNSRSLNQGKTKLKSSERWIHCRSKMWTSECNDGTVVIATLGRAKESLCEYTCLWEPMCKTYIYSKEGGNCAITSASEGTTTSNGIAGPTLPLVKPTKKKSRKVKKSRLRVSEDCTEYHYGKCNFTNNTFTAWDIHHDSKACQTMCKTGSDIRLNCLSFGFNKIEGGTYVIGNCGRHSESVLNFVHNNCEEVSGKILPETRQGTIEKFDSCITEMGYRPCRKGNCNLDHYGSKLGEDVKATEKKCKDWCFGYFNEGLMQPCTHYKYHPEKATAHPNMYKCLLFHVNTTTSSSYKCNMIAGGEDVSDADREKCLEDVHPVPDIVSDACHPNPCINGGTCDNGQCDCKTESTGFSGSKCEIDQRVGVAWGNSSQHMLKLSEYSGSGNVLIKMEGSAEWLPVCDDFSDTETAPKVAKVVCRSLGFKTTISNNGSSYYGEVSDDFALDDVVCNGTEESLADCTYTTEENCDANECWGVACK